MAEDVLILFLKIKDRNLQIMNKRMIKRVIRIVVLLLALGNASLWAQQEPLNTMYMYNGISVNPAYTGTRDALSLTGLHRHQWANMPGAPITTSFSAHSPIMFTNMGVGITLVADKIGPVSDIYTTLFYAYRVKLGDELTLSLGLNFGIYSYNANLNSLSPDEAGGYDQVLEDASKTTVNGGTGFYLYHKNYYVGFAIPKLFQSNVNGYSADASNLMRHYYLSAGYVFHLNEDFALKPSFLTKIVEGAPITNDLNMQLFMYDKFSLGLSYRISNGVAFMAGYHIANKWMVGYAYGLSTSDLSTYNDGSHEIVLTYDLRLSKSVVRSPRYF